MTGDEWGGLGGGRNGSGESDVPRRGSRARRVAGRSGEMTCHACPVPVQPIRKLKRLAAAISLPHPDSVAPKHPAGSPYSPRELGRSLVAVARKPRVPIQASRR